MLRPLIRWIAPGASEETLLLVHAGVRKLAHLAEYAVLGALVLRALDRPPRRSGSTIAWAVLLCAAYAGLDELHQTWVPSRTGALLDVAIDTGGAAFGVALRAWSGSFSADRRS